MYDIIVVGAGPAGITASIYAARKMMKLLVITGDIGGQANWTEMIDNYTGYQFIKGSDLMEKFHDHLKQFKVEIRQDEAVISAVQTGGVIRVKTEKNEYETKTLIAASGRTHRKLDVEGEDEFAGKGLVYCATCDAPLFKDAEVAVVGGGNSAMDACLQLEKIAKKIYIIDLASEFRADPVMVKKALSSGKVRPFYDTKVIEITGDKFVTGLKLEQNGKIEDLDVQGIFVEIGSMPSTGYLKDVKKNEKGEVFVNCRCETDIPGIFAAGDVTDVPAKQIIVACGEGAKAAISAFNYISTKQ